MTRCRLPLVACLLMGVSAASVARAADDEATLLYEREKAALSAELEALRRERRRGVADAAEYQRRSERAADELRAEWAALATSNAELEDTARRLARQTESDSSTAEVHAELAAIEERAKATLRLHGGTVAAAPAPEQRWEHVFAAAIERLQLHSQVVREPGGFFGASGDWQAGELVRIGAVAALGVSADGSEAGVLVLADTTGALRLLPPVAAENGEAAAQSDDAVSQAEAARRLVRGESVGLVPLFVFDPLDFHPIAAGDGHAGHDHDRSRTWREKLDAAGPLGWPILLLGAFALLVFGERLLHLARWHWRWRLSEAHVARRLAGASSSSASGEPPQQVRGAQRALWESAARVQALAANARAEALAAAVDRQSSRLERGLPWLKVVAATAPLLGLLGTVMGMIQTFDVLTTHGAGDAQLLSGGISQALLTTELGLLVAVPVLLLHSALASAAERSIDRLEGRSVEWLVALASPSPSPSPSASSSLRSASRAAPGTDQLDSVA